MEPYIREYIPEVEIMHLCDDTIQRDNIKAGAGVIPKVNSILNLPSMRIIWRKQAWI